jgi:hypothetical protein
MMPKRRIRLARAFMLDVLFEPQARPFFIYILINIFLGATIYRWLEGWSWLDSFYFVVITLTTIGYGDFTPTTTAAKLITIFYSINGVILLLVLFDLVRSVRGWDQKHNGANETKTAPNDTVQNNNMNTDNF